MKKCIVIRLDHLGDLIQTTPLFRALKTAGYKVEVLVPGKIAPILDNNPDLDVVHILEVICPDFPKTWLQLALWLRLQRYSHLFLPHAKPKQLLWASAFSGISKRVAMWSGVWGRVTGHTAIRSGTYRGQKHMCEILLQCAQSIGVQSRGLRPVIVLSQKEIEGARSLLSDHLPKGEVIGIHPGGNGSACNLPASHYGELAEAILRETSASLVITGSPSEVHLCEGWAEEVKNSPRVWLSMGHLTDANEPDLRMLAAVISQMDLLVVSSTGPLQIASALGRPSISPFCAYPPDSFQVWGSGYGESVCPSKEFCQKWKAAGQGQCDFRGSITVRKLLESVKETLANLKRLESSGS